MKIIIAKYSLDIAQYVTDNYIPPRNFIGVTTDYYGSWFKLHGRIVDIKNIIWLPGWDKGRHADEVNKTLYLCIHGGIFT